MTRNAHENASQTDKTNGKASIAKESAKMNWTLPPNLPVRPPLPSQQSNSLPSTPYQRPRQLSFTSRSPSPNHAVFSTSPRSTHSESNHPLPSLRPQQQGCKYEAGMAFSRRRMPYTLGGDLLEKASGPLKEHLDDDEVLRIEKQILAAYEGLLPSKESDKKRNEFLEKLERILNQQWPGKDIKVHVFGSSGNKLCSSDSDVDVCITTTFKELEHVCILAEALAQHGMQKVICVSTAKVPIVKIWDPVLEIACDMNVNNTLALENTRMIRTYVDLDERVRPLAMLIKYWTKRRIVNDAALGGTLSSYTWICMIINFLQTREPPILPSLQKRAQQKKDPCDGASSSFDDDLDALRGFGSANKERLGELLFQFYRYYGYEIDFESSVVSVREGKVINKKEKGWHFGQNNRLCVEEPFNTTRNLGNTADDSSFRGLHLELRRAFGAIAKGNFDEFCEQYEFPREEERERIFERPPPVPRPILTSTPSAQGRAALNASARGRGGRHNGSNRGGGNHNSNNSRRPSNSSNRNNYRHGNVLSPSEAALQAHNAQAQVLLHDHLFQQIQFLQAQEQELRIQLQQQAYLNGRSPPVMRQPYLQIPVPGYDAVADENTRARSGTINHPPLSAPLRQQMGHIHPGYFQLGQQPTSAGPITNPPSPSLAPSGPDIKRSSRRMSFQNGNPSGTLRAHSQPARPIASHLSLQNLAALQQQQAQRNEVLSSHRARRPSSPTRLSSADYASIRHQSSSLPRTEQYDGRPSEYIGYYVGGSPHIQSFPNGLVSPMHNLSIALRSGALYPWAPYGYRTSNVASTAETRNGASRPSSSERTPSPPSKPVQRSPVKSGGPLIVNGSVASSEPRHEAPVDLVERYLSSSHPTSISDSYAETRSSSFSDAQSLDMPAQSTLLANAQAHGSTQFSASPSSQATEPQSIHPEGYDRGYDMRDRSCSSTSPPTQSFKHNGTGLETPVSQSDLSGRKYEVANPLARASHGLTDQQLRDISANHGMHHDSVLPLLSPVKEIRTPSPSTVRSGLSPERERQFEKIGAVAKERPIFKMENRQPPQQHSKSASNKERQAPSRKPNGTAPHHETSRSATNGSQWQTSKKKKRAPRSTHETNGNHRHGGEPLPVDEHMRKGG